MYIFVLSRVRSKYIIPKPGRDAEALVVGFEVVRHVMSAQFHEILALEAEMMQGVVGHVVDHVAKHETCKDSIDIIWKFEQAANNAQEQRVEDRCKWNADHGRHHQPGLLPRLGMVHAVHQEQHALHSLVCPGGTP